MRGLVTEAAHSVARSGAVRRLVHLCARHSGYLGLLVAMGAFASGPSELLEWGSAYEQHRTAIGAAQTKADVSAAMGSLPVSCVSRQEGGEFCEWNRRLPGGGVVYITKEDGSSVPANMVERTLVVRCAFRADGGRDPKSCELTVDDGSKRPEP